MASSSSLRLGAPLSHRSPSPSSSRSTCSCFVQSARPLVLPEARRASTTRSSSAAAASECRSSTSLSPAKKAPLRPFRASNCREAARKDNNNILSRGKGTSTTAATRSGKEEACFRSGDLNNSTSTPREKKKNSNPFEKKKNRPARGRSPPCFCCRGGIRRRLSFVAARLREVLRVGEGKKSLSFFLSLSLSLLSLNLEQKNSKKKTQKKKNSLSRRPRPPPAALGLCPRRRPARRRALPLQRGQDLPGRRDRAHGCGARLEARDAR